MDCSTHCHAGLWRLHDVIVHACLVVWVGVCVRLQGLPHIQSLLCANEEEEAGEGEEGESVAEEAALWSFDDGEAVAKLRASAEAARAQERADAVLRDDVRKFYAELGGSPPLPLCVPPLAWCLSFLPAKYMCAPSPMCVCVCACACSSPCVCRCPLPPLPRLLTEESLDESVIVDRYLVQDMSVPSPFFTDVSTPLPFLC